MWREEFRSINYLCLRDAITLATCEVVVVGGNRVSPANHELGLEQAPAQASPKALRWNVNSVYRDMNSDNTVELPPRGGLTTFTFSARSISTTEHQRFDTLAAAGLDFSVTLLGT